MRFLNPHQEGIADRGARRIHRTIRPYLATGIPGTTWHEETP
jgi:hypothetical protein